MSRITGSDALGLMEAYNAVYASQELTEEQVWEEVEAWVNSLVEEGYDLSDYTWEDMYEEYLNEMGQRATTGQATAPRPRSQQGPSDRGLMPGLTIGSGGFNVGGRPVQPGMSSIFQRPGQAPVSRPGQAPVSRPGQAPVSRPGQAPAARPSTSAPTRSKPLWGGGGSTARPAQSARPSTSAPTRSEPLWGGGGSQAGSTPVPTSSARSFNPLMQRTFGYQTGFAPGQVAARTATAFSPNTQQLTRTTPISSTPISSTPTQRTTTAFSSSTPNLASRSTTPARRPVTPTRAPVLQRSHFDPFDVVMGYLIDEGYAGNEEAAAVIMANMSEEWRQSIIEQDLTDR